MKCGSLSAVHCWGSSVSSKSPRWLWCHMPSGEFLQVFNKNPLIYLPLGTEVVLSSGVPCVSRGPVSATFQVIPSFSDREVMPLSLCDLGPLLCPFPGSPRGEAGLLCPCPCTCFPFISLSVDCTALVCVPVSGSSCAASVRPVASDTKGRLARNV